MSFSDTIIRKARSFVVELFQGVSLQKYAYHNLQHTLNVVAAGNFLGRKMGLSKSEMEIVELAALFHDTGYLHHWQQHEEKSAEIASQFLRKQQYPEDRIAQVCACIRATKMPQRPTNLLERVICDADLLHLGKDCHLSKAFLLREEMEVTRGRYLCDRGFYEGEIRFLSQHEFQTSFARQHFSTTKADNIDRLQRLLQFFSLNVA